MKPSSTPLDDLKYIYSAIFIQDLSEYDPCVDSTTQRVSDQYELTTQQIYVLAYLVNRLNDNSASYWACSEVEEKAVTLNLYEDVDDLVRRGFIEKNYEEVFPVGFKLSRNAFLAFQAGTAFCEKSETLIDILTEPISGSIFTAWFRRIERCLNRRCNNGLLTLLENLGVMSYSSIDVRMVFWLMAKQFLENFTQPLAFKGEEMVSEWDIESEGIKKCIGQLVKDGLVDSLPIDSNDNSNETDRFVLSEKVVESLFQGHKELVKYDEMSKYATIIKAQDIVEKDLYFSTTTSEQIDNLWQVLSEEGFRNACDILQRKHRKPGIQALLWGPPGTGKTEVIKQLARRSGRDIILVDFSKLYGSLWGETEKTFRGLFRAYNYVVLLQDAPILLFNEADSILSQRLSSTEKSIDRSENTVTNILLQGIEDMRGILLATTNLIGNLDKAFDRRFLFKIEIPNPDQAARTRIWKASIPELTEQEAAELGGFFEMSGAQINNVATKRDLAELYYKGSRGLAFIKKLCTEELSVSTKRSGGRNRIGFN